MPLLPNNTVPTHHLVIVRPEGSDQFLAQVMGFPEVRAVAASAEEAVKQARANLAELLASAQVVPISVPMPRAHHPNSRQPNSIAVTDAVEQAYLEELARFRLEDRERTIQEDEQACSGSSSIPTI